ncbi:hypothetical protein DEU56DRAFT_754119 [Suillus clintonianus]|uniref:uncharacterized protein n=1 Tax=Suillus clintonianus TaxID=1904413 RepID=UPI001B87FB50|nr:uncharacterized protein DEU56DRAFT_754119 [Suillus clintonianus]KAG2145262.1 hypothetical protein DEU56DRAFT_754119 [Suillus clintonianus]
MSKSLFVGYMVILLYNRVIPYLCVVALTQEPLEAVHSLPIITESSLSGALDWGENPWEEAPTATTKPQRGLNSSTIATSQANSGLMAKSLLSRDKHTANVFLSPQANINRAKRLPTITSRSTGSRMMFGTRNHSI